MDKASRIDPYKIDYTSITLLAGNVTFSDPKYSGQDIKSFVSTFEVEHKVDFDTKEILMILDTQIYIVTTDNVQLPIEASYKIENCFCIENFEEFIIVEKDDNVALDGLLGQTLLGIVYSTMRGIIFTRLQGTLFDGFIMPVIAPKDFLENGKLSLTLTPTMKKEKTLKK